MNIEVFNQTTQGSINGTMKFPTVIQLLMENGVEAYHVDLVRNEKTFYMPNGDSHKEKFNIPKFEIAKEFSSEKVKATIKESQASKITYIEFLESITKAGSNYYIVYLNGRKAIYFGRNGDLHIENFPQ